MNIPSPLGALRSLAIRWVFSNVPVPFGLAPWVFGFGMNAWPHKVKGPDPK